MAMMEKRNAIERRQVLVRAVQTLSRHLVGLESLVRRGDEGPGEEGWARSSVDVWVEAAMVFNEAIVRENEG